MFYRKPYVFYECLEDVFCTLSLSLRIFELSIILHDHGFYFVFPLAIFNVYVWLSKNTACAKETSYYKMFYHSARGYLNRVLKGPRYVLIINTNQFHGLINPDKSLTCFSFKYFLFILFRFPSFFY